MNIMILGAGGLIGQQVSLALIEGGHKPLNVSRRGGTVKGADWVQADRSDPATILSIIRAHKIGAVIDMVGRDEASSKALIDVIDGQISRYIFISSGDVYRNHGLIHRVETGEPDAGPLTEQSPLRAGRYPYRLAAPRAEGDPQKWMDAYDKIPIEQHVQAMQSGWTICRLPMVYGADGELRRFDWIIGPMKAKAARLELPVDWLAWTTTYGHVANVADAIIATLTHPAAVREIFNITDHPAMPNHDWVKAFARVFDWRVEIVPTTDYSHPIAQLTSTLDLSVSLNVSGEKLQRLTGYLPTLDFEACLRLCDLP